MTVRTMVAPEDMTRFYRIRLKVPHTDLWGTEFPAGTEVTTHQVRGVETLHTAPGPRFASATVGHGDGYLVHGGDAEIVAVWDRQHITIENDVYVWKQNGHPDKLAPALTLDEAIIHANDMAQKCHGTMCGDEHEQLTTWLQELRGNREVDPREVSDE